MQLDINPQFKTAFDIVENSNDSLFITGKAGTGKSTFLNYFKENTQKSYVLLAPTGVAAVNIGGQTIHSFFRFGIDTLPSTMDDYSPPSELRKILSSLDLIIVDEISMVRADLLDCIDVAIRKTTGRTEPFGGIQMLFIGDLFQLPPVARAKDREILSKLGYESEYFFDSFVFKNPSFKIKFIEFTKIYRQQDQKFIEILNKIRVNDIDAEDIEFINQRYNITPDPNKFYVYMATTNKIVDQINKKALNDLPGPKHEFHAQITGDFDINDAPTNAILELKEGAQIMLINNERNLKWVNGTLGIVTNITADPDNPYIEVKLETGEIVQVRPYTWEQFTYKFDNKQKSVYQEVVGTFTQFPIKLAWAMTIHKSQGKTFDNIIIDIGKGTFSPGQLYVALSRARSFEGIILKRRISKKHIWADGRIKRFFRKFMAKNSNLTLDQKIKILRQAAKTKTKLEILYYKDTGQSVRTILPKKVQKMKYRGYEFYGVVAYCYTRGEDRTFSVEKILDIRKL